MFTLKSRLILIVLLLLALSLAGLASFARLLLRQNADTLLSDQQYSTTRFVSDEIHTNVVGLVRALEITAENLPAGQILSPSLAEPALQGQPALHNQFTGGIFAISREGRVLGDYPVIPGRRGADVSDRDYFRQVIASGRPAIGTPVIGRSDPQVPILVMAVPVRDRAGNVLGLLAGTIQLRSLNLLGLMVNRRYGKTGGFLLVSPSDRKILMASDPGRIMEPLESGSGNTMLERCAAGFEGSGIGMNARGVEELVSCRKIESTGWFLATTLPADEAFRSVRETATIIMAATFLLAGVLLIAVRLIIRRILQPLDAATASIQRMASGTMEPAPLSVPDPDNEVGRLLTSFNILEREVIERGLELKAMFETSGVGIVSFDAVGRVRMVNRKLIEMLGAQEPAELTGLSYLDLVFPDRREQARSIFSSLIKHDSNELYEKVALHTKSGGTVWCMLSAKRFPGEEEGILAVLADISEIEEVREQLQANEQSLASLLDLSQRSHGLTEKEICDQALQVTLQVTHSDMASAHTVNEDGSVSLLALRDERRNTVSELHNTFIAGSLQQQAAGQKQSILNNHPDSGSDIGPFLVVPALEGERARLVLSAANKLIGYRDSDRLQVEFIASELQKIIMRKRAEADLQGLLEMAQDGIFIYDPAGKLLYCNAAAILQTGYFVEDLLHRDVELLVSEEDRPRFYHYLEHLTTEGNPLSEWNMLRRDGTLLPIEISSRILPDGRFLTIARDISDRVAAQEKLRQAARVFESTAEGVLITDADEKIQAVNKAFLEITGFSEDEIIGQTPRILKSQRQDVTFYEKMWHQLKTEGRWTGEIWNRRKDGRVYPEWITISDIRNEAGQTINYVAVFSDISQLKESEVRLDYMAHHDLLTGLSNRALFQARLEHSLDRAIRENRQLAVLFIDLDHFKNVNDTLGHSVGDRLLTAVARRMQTQLRKVDTLARLGGDEFILFLEDLESGRDAAIVAEKILRMLDSPIHADGSKEFLISASIGISLFPEDGRTVDTLIKNADAAMYEAKKFGRNSYRYYTEEITNLVFKNMLIEAALRNAVRQDELALWYQPQYEMATGQLIGLEALLRWKHPELGLLPPAEFISIAEHSGLIHPIGEWVLFEVCRQMRAWMDQGIHIPRVAVNVSMQQFERGHLSNLVRSALATNNISPECLEIELTESVLMSDTNHALTLLEDLHAIGVQLSIDDFGTGYSSLSYLRQMPLQRLKIDKSFIQDAPNDPNSAAIVRAIIAMAGSLGLKVIAEGVERPDQSAFLLRERCDEVQGFLFGRPAPASDFPDNILSLN